MSRDVPRYLGTYLDRNKDKDKSGFTGGSSRDRVQVGLEVNAEIYRAFLRLCPYRGAGRVLESLMAKYIAEQAGKPDVIINQSLMQYIHAEPFSKVTINNKIQQKTFTAVVRRVESDPIWGDREIEETMEVTERDLIDLRGIWPPISERSRQRWREILRQIDHPIAKEILLRDQKEAV